MDPHPLPHANSHGSNVAGRAGTRRAESTLEETHGDSGNPPKLFSGVESTTTKGSKIDGPTAMSAKLVTGENGLVAIATKTGDTYQTLPKGTALQHSSNHQLVLMVLNLAPT